MFVFRLIGAASVTLVFLAAQPPAAPAPAQPGAPGAPSAAAAPAQPAPATYTVAPGTKLPLSLINSISTKHSSPGDSVYLETAFPVMAGGRIAIPAGSYVTGTVSEIKRPRRANGLGQLYIRFDTLTLPNGVTRDFRGRVNHLDGDTKDKVDPEGKVTAETNTAGDVQTVMVAAEGGTDVGAIAGAASGHAVMGLGLGAAAGAAAGMIGIMAAHPDAILERGSTVEMIIDRPITYSEKDLDFGNYQPPHFAGQGPAAPDVKKSGAVGRPIPN